MRALSKRLGSGRLGSRKGRSASGGGGSEAVDPAYIGIEPPAHVEGDLRKENAELRQRLGEAEAHAAAARSQVDKLRGHRSSQQREIESLRRQPSDKLGATPAASDAQVQCSVPFVTHGLRTGTAPAPAGSQARDPGAPVDSEWRPAPTPCGPPARLVRQLEAQPRSRGPGKRPDKFVCCCVHLRVHVWHA